MSTRNVLKYAFVLILALMGTTKAYPSDAGDACIAAAKFVEDIELEIVLLKEKIKSGVEEMRIRGNELNKTNLIIDAKKALLEEFESSIKKHEDLIKELRQRGYAENSPVLMPLKTKVAELTRKAQNLKLELPYLIIDRDAIAKRVAELAKDQAARGSKLAQLLDEVVKTRKVIAAAAKKLGVFAAVKKILDDITKAGKQMGSKCKGNTKFFGPAGEFLGLALTDFEEQRAYLESIEDPRVRQMTDAISPVLMAPYDEVMPIAEILVKMDVAVYDFMGAVTSMLFEGKTGSYCGVPLTQDFKYRGEWRCIKDDSGGGGSSNGSTDGSEERGGCTDPKAKNYDPAADWDDGSCIY